MNVRDDAEDDVPHHPLKFNNSGKRTILDYWNSHSLNGGPKFQKQKPRFMVRLWQAMQKHEQVVVLTRGLCEPRAVLIGNLMAFDRYWNLLLANVTEHSIQLNNSSFSGHGKRNRSQRRRQQRRSAKSRLLASTDRSIKCTTFASGPPEIGDVFALDCVSDDTLVWGIRDTIIPDGETAMISHSIDSMSLAKDSSDVSVQTNRQYPSNSRWISSVAQLNSRVVLDPNIGASVSGSEQLNTTHSPGKPISEYEAVSSERNEHRGQLFIRGANIIYIRFPSDNG